VKEEAVKGVKAIPGLIQGGVDVIYNEDTNKFQLLKLILNLV